MSAMISFSMFSARSKNAKLGYSSFYDRWDKFLRVFLHLVALVLGTEFVMLHNLPAN
jgi:hypothetical protein